MTRTGLGFDLHPLVDGPLVLGGVTVGRAAWAATPTPTSRHAIGEALLGASALGDLGRHFPIRTPLCKRVELVLLSSHGPPVVKGAHLRTSTRP